MIFKLIRNQNGSMIVNAIATSIIIAIISGVILQQSLTSIKTLRLPRIKSVMTSTEGSLRFLLIEAQNYRFCDADTGGFLSCDFTGDVTKLGEVIPGCNPTPCGVVVVPTGGWNAATRTYTADIVYQGDEVAVAPRSVTIVVPIEILTQANVNCPPAAQPDDILFLGFNADGTKKCGAIPGNAAGCPAGQYLAGLNPSTLQIDCRPISDPGGPATPDIDCGANMVEGVTFLGNTFSRTCKPRVPPTSAGWPTAPNI